MTPRERATSLARQLFHNAVGDRAERLMLVDKDNRDLGGWAFLPIVDQIESAIAAAVSEKDAEIERLRAAIAAMKVRCTCDLNEYSYCDCGADAHNARIDALLEGKE